MTIHDDLHDEDHDDDHDEAEADPRALIELWQGRREGATYADLASITHSSSLEIAAMLAVFADMIDAGMDAPEGTADAIRDDLRANGFPVTGVAALQAAYDAAHGIPEPAPTMN